MCPEEGKKKKEKQQKNYQLKIKRTVPLEDLDQEQVDSRDFKVNTLWSKLNFGSINMVNTFFI